MTEKEKKDVKPTKEFKSVKKEEKEKASPCGCGCWPPAKGQKKS